LRRQTWIYALVAALTARVELVDVCWSRALRAQQRLGKSFDMPQLARGGKYVYGWSKVSEGGRIAIPAEAMPEYGLKEHDKVILMSGSRRSGGFAVTTPGLLGGSPLSAVLQRFPRLRTFQMPEGRVVRVEGRPLCWTSIGEDGSITLPEETLREYEVLPGDRLLAVRGSGLALGFALRGPLVDEALTHSEIEVFE
jgi:bifunctional DNA-binding transcriptional regulator/antitoxin component of YhaV-PrlF toxin-antitoxin module